MIIKKKTWLDFGVHWDTISLKSPELMNWTTYLQGLQNLQQPLYAGYDELQMLQQRLPPLVSVEGHLSIESHFVCVHGPYELHRKE